MSLLLKQIISYLLGWFIEQQMFDTHFENSLTGPPNQQLACFVPFLKMINTFSKK